MRQEWQAGLATEVINNLGKSVLIGWHDLRLVCSVFQDSDIGDSGLRLECASRGPMMQKGRIKAMAGEQNQNQALKYLGW